MTRAQHPDDGLILSRAQVLAPAMDALRILDWINERPELYFGTIDEAVLAACDAINGHERPYAVILELPRKRTMTVRLLASDPEDAKRRAEEFYSGTAVAAQHHPLPLP